MPPTLESVEQRIQQGQETVQSEEPGWRNTYRQCAVNGLGELNTQFDSVFTNVCHVSADRLQLVKAFILFDELSSVLTQLVAQPGDDSEEA